MASRAPVTIRPGSRRRQIGWAMALGLALAGFLALTFKVNAIKSEVRLAERQIIAIEREKLMLETEFQTRSSQRQLAAWNAVEFGYVPPVAGQVYQDRRDLALLGVPRALGAPEPIRVARADIPAEEGLFAEWSLPSAEDEPGQRPLPVAYSAGSAEAGSLAQRLMAAPPLPSRIAEAGQ